MNRRGSKWGWLGGFACGALRKPSRGPTGGPCKEGFHKGTWAVHTAEATRVIPQLCTNCQHAITVRLGVCYFPDGGPPPGGPRPPHESSGVPRHRRGLQGGPSGDPFAEAPLDTHTPLPSSLLLSLMLRATSTTGFRIGAPPWGPWGPSVKGGRGRPLWGCA